MRQFFLIFFALTTAGSSQPLPAAEYSGFVGRSKCSFTLEWHTDRTVTGVYRSSVRPGVTYTLSGRNLSEGVLYLEEYTDGKFSALCHLEKRVSDFEVTWQGEMRNIDGRNFPMSFSRLIEESAVALPDYRGSVNVNFVGWFGEAAARFDLELGAPNIRGRYLYIGDSFWRSFYLTGKSVRDGEMVLDEFDDGRLTARFNFKKLVTGQQTIWKGVRQSIEGQSVAITLVEGRGLIKVKECLKKLPKEVVWNDFPMANEAIKMVQLDHWREVWIEGKIEAFKVGHQGTEIAVRTRLPEDEQDGDSFVCPVITFKINRVLPFPQERMVGSEVGFLYDEYGKVDNLGLTSIAITHWRKRSDGMVEIRGPLDYEELRRSHELEPEKRAELLSSLPFVAFVPDKLAIEEEPIYEFIHRGIRITRAHGVCVQALAAGPGGIELESISLENFGEEIPWVFLGDEGVGNSVPATQHTGEAG